MRIRLLILSILALGCVAILYSFDQEGQTANREALQKPIVTELTPIAVLEELKCTACHSDLPAEEPTYQYAPYLDNAGNRYNPGYLFSYLSNPTKVRHSIGHARMPDFHLTKEESLALTLFLSEQKADGDLDVDFPTFSNRSKKPNEVEAVSLLEQMTCLTCHQLEGRGIMLNTELSHISYRLKKEWVQRYMAAPGLFNRSHVVMPSLFYQIDGNQVSPLSGQSQEQIEQITTYLFSLNQDRRTNLNKEFETYKKEHNHITADLGAQIYKSLNCAGCHEFPANSFSGTIAPSLSNAANRLQANWLKDYLAKPHAVRPSGYNPGYGSRMPDYRLSEEEVNLIVEYFGNQDKSKSQFTPDKLSRFSMDKAESLVMERYACTGCHQIDGRGGKIGPNLDGVRKRLLPDYVHQIIKDPQSVAPHAVMPKIPMPDKTIRLLANYLIQKEPTRVDEPYISFTSLENHLQNQGSDYQQFCAPCHGVTGNADGYNAQFLTIPPTKHADKNYVSLRPDDTLFDGIYSGGFMLNKSHQMPPYGHRLKRSQIDELVSYIRNLCDCEEPKWASDNH